MTVFATAVLTLSSFAGDSVRIYYRANDVETAVFQFSYEPTANLFGHIESRRHLYARDIKHYVEKELKADLKEFIRSQGFSVPLDARREQARQAAEDLVGNDLEKDIDLSPYQVREKCFDEEEAEKEGATLLPKLLPLRPGEIRAPVSEWIQHPPICFSPELLLENWFDPNPAVSWSEIRERILALAVHEHSHHFGYADRDHALYGFAFERAIPYGEGGEAIRSVEVSPRFAEARTRFQLLDPSSAPPFVSGAYRCRIWADSTERYAIASFDQAIVTPDEFVSAKLAIRLEGKAISELGAYLVDRNEWRNTWGGKFSEPLYSIAFRMDPARNLLFFEVAHERAAGLRNELTSIVDRADTPYAVGYGECHPE